MGPARHVKPGALKPHRTRALKPHRAHLVRRVFEAYRPLLLEAHRPRSRTRSHVVKVRRCVKALHRALKVPRSGPLTLKPYGCLRVRRAVKPAHTVSAPHWTM